MWNRVRRLLAEENRILDRLFKDTRVFDRMIDRLLADEGRALERLFNFLRKLSGTPEERTLNRLQQAQASKKKDPA